MIPGAFAARDPVSAAIIDQSPVPFYHFTGPQQRATATGGASVLYRDLHRALFGGPVQGAAIDPTPPMLGGNGARSAPMFSQAAGVGLSATYGGTPGSGAAKPGGNASSAKLPRVASNGASFGLPRITSGAQLERNPSLQFSMEFDEEGHQASPADSMKVKAVLEQLWRLMACSNPVEHEMQKIVHDARDALPHGEVLTSAKLAKAFEAEGYEVCIRTALGGGQGVDCLHNLRHNFLVVRPVGKPGEASYIVDIEFRAQFQVAHATLQYRTLVSNMDGEFIGTPTKLRNVIQLLCDEMALAFRELDMGLPPWRQTNSMLSKWCPRRSEDHLPDGRRFSDSNSEPTMRIGSQPTQDHPMNPLPWELSTGDATILA